MVQDQQGLDPLQQMFLEHFSDMLALTCDGHARTLDGDFTDKTSNSFDSASIGIKSAHVVDGQARIRHARGPEDQGCLTLQRLDEPSTSRDECDAERLTTWQDHDPAQDTQPTTAHNANA